MRIFVYGFREFDERQYFEELSKKRAFEYSVCPDAPSLENAHLAQGYDGITFTPSIMDESLLRKFNELGIKNIVSRSVGYDHVDLKAAKALGIKIGHVNYPPEAVADYTIMMILMMLRKIPYILEQSLVQNYELKGKIGKSIKNSTIGVIGTGKIGTTLIHRLVGFGCKIIAYDPYISNSVKEMVEYVDLECLYQRSDVITLHVPAMDSNFHLLDEKAFKQMKNDVIIVNTSRGSLIDTNDLIAALEKGIIGGAALDVLEDESDIYANKIGQVIINRDRAILQSFPNVLLTPHTAFYTDVTVANMALDSINNLYDMKEGLDNPLIIVK